ncbi:protein of unknown function [Mesotoga infera]|uniref:Uncharacterized protein n=1 Tax=Mesotoga infera TaxID=1236046 RepID=A0A7Z7LGN4_9BACT|nr:protein of unknown function [Mesotoga infera]
MRYHFPGYTVPDYPEQRFVQNRLQGYNHPIKERQLYNYTILSSIIEISLKS